MSQSLMPAEPAPIPLFDLKRQERRLRPELDRAIAAVLDHGQFILGPEVTALENALAAFSGVRHCIAVSSGRDALLMALMALGVGPGDAVFVPAFTFSATAAAVMAAGARPIFVDVLLDSANMDPEDLERAIADTEGLAGATPKAIIPVDLFGLPADYAAIGAIAAEHGLAVLADAAQSFGGAVGNARVGAFGAISAISFYPTKPLGGYGDGGAVMTDDDALADAVRQIRTHGRAGDGDVAMRIGLTGRLDTIQAAILNVKLAGFAEELARRGEVAALYDALLPASIARPVVPAGVRSAYALYTVRVPARDAVRASLAAADIGTGLFYRVPLHRHPAFEPLVPPHRSFPIADFLSDTVLSLPMGPDVTDAEVERVARALAAAVGQPLAA